MLVLKRGKGSKTFFFNLTLTRHFCTHHTIFSALLCKCMQIYAYYVEHTYFISKKTYKFVQKRGKIIKPVMVVAS